MTASAVLANVKAWKQRVCLSITASALWVTCTSVDDSSPYTDLLWSMFGRKKHFQGESDEDGEGRGMGWRKDQEAWLWAQHILGAHVIATQRNLQSVQSIHTNKQTHTTEALLRQGCEKLRKSCPTQQRAHRKIRGQSQLNDRMPGMSKPLGSILTMNKDKEVRK